MVAVQNMLGTTPKLFNVVTMMLCTAFEIPGVINNQMLPKLLRQLITPKDIDIVHRALMGILIIVHKCLGRDDRLHDLGKVPAIPFKQVKDDAFAASSPPALTLHGTPKAGLIHSNSPRKFPSLECSRMEQIQPQSLIGTSNDFGTHTQITCESLDGQLSIKPLQDRDLLAQLGATFLFGAEYAFHIAKNSLRVLKRTTEKILTTFKKVGRTKINCICVNSHRHRQGYNGNKTT